MSAFTTRVALALTGALLFASPAFAAASATAPATIAQVEKAAGHKVVLGHTVVLQTTGGTIEIVLFPKEAPKTVANFEKLVKKGFYNGTVFHRVIPGFVSQGGDPEGTGMGGPGYQIPDEHGNGLKHIPGAVAMAHSSMPNSAGSQFYITHGAIPHLDGGYTIFGQVTKGFDVAIKMTPSERDGAPNQTAKPTKIIKATLK